MAREGLMDDCGYHECDECSHYESCTEEAFKNGCEYALNLLIDCLPESEKISKDILIGIIKSTKSYCMEEETND